MGFCKFFTSLSVLLVLVLVASNLLGDQVTASPVDKEIHRDQRARYRVGYMFGKRSSSTPDSSTLFDIVSRGLLTKKELEMLILKDPEILSEIATILDKNDDGYISVLDLL